MYKMDLEKLQLSLSLSYYDPRDAALGRGKLFLGPVVDFSKTSKFF